MIFSIPKSQQKYVHGDTARNVPEHFAYVEWFSRLTNQPEPWHGLRRIKRSIINNNRVQNERSAAIVPVDRVRRSVALFPRFGRTVDPEWTADNVLERCSEFYVNSFSDKHTYVTVP